MHCSMAKSYSIYLVKPNHIINIDMKMAHLCKIRLNLVEICHGMDEQAVKDTSSGLLRYTMDMDVLFLKSRTFSTNLR